MLLISARNIEISNCGNDPSGFHKMRVISWIVVEVLASGEGLYCMEFVADHGIEVDEITALYLWL